MFERLLSLSETVVNATNFNCVPCVFLPFVIQFACKKKKTVEMRNEESKRTNRKKQKYTETVIVSHFLLNVCLEIKSHNEMGYKLSDPF